MKIRDPDRAMTASQGHVRHAALDNKISLRADDMPRSIAPAASGASSRRSQVPPKAVRCGCMNIR
jgi:hypothetical protein